MTTYHPTPVTSSAVRVGSEWKDNGFGSVDRRVRVDELDKKYARCTVVSNGKHPSERGHRVRVLLSRFNLKASGFSPVEGGGSR